VQLQQSPPLTELNATAHGGDDEDLSTRDGSTHTGSDSTRVNPHFGGKIGGDTRRDFVFSKERLFFTTDGNEKSVLVSRRFPSTQSHVMAEVVFP
jgi:hypothetical protein